MSRSGQPALCLPDVVRRAAAGDEQAWTELVDRYAGLLRRVAAEFRLTGEEAADAAQNTWLAIFRKIDGLEDPESIGAWLATTMRRECLGVLRHRKREQAADDWEQWPVEDQAASVDRALLLAERDTLLWRFVDRLPHQQRRLLRALETTPRPSYQSVADTLAVPIGTLGPTRGRAVRRLQELFAEAGVTEDAVEVA